MSLLDTASLLLTPNAYKEGKLYSVIPSDGSGDFTFTRATTATRVNSDGLVELVPYNLFERSEEFNNNGYWNKLGSTISANAIVAPNGTTTADKVIETSTTADHYVTRANNFTQGLTYTISVYAKAGERNWVSLGFNNEAQRLAWFNLTTGVVGTVLSSVTSTSIESVGNGWYRCSATMTAATNLPYPSVMIAPSDGVKNYLGNGTNGLYIWGAQLVEGSTALPYQKTETRLNIPRLDYSNGSCPSLLVEPQGTNLALYSEQFDNAYWSKTDITLAANNTIAPSGVQSADRIIEDATNNRHRIFKIISKSTVATTYTFSIYVKNYSGTRNVRVSLESSIGGSRATVVFDTNGNIVEAVSVFGTFTNPSVSAKLEGGYWRYSLTATSDIGNLIIPIVLLNNGTTDVYLGDGTSGVYLWGAQLELGSYSTSYIPTTTASVTRNNDSCVKTSATALIGQNEGTMFAEIEVSKLIGIASRYIFHISDGTVNNRIYMAFSGSSSNVLRGRIFNGGTLQCSIDTSTITSTGTYKLALAYKNNDIVFYVNGVQIGVNTSATIPTCSRVDVGQNYANTSQFSDGIKASVLWKTRLTNAELAQLTTI